MRPSASVYLVGWRAGVGGHENRAWEREGISEMWLDAWWRMFRGCGH
jgi:hypothetical protein